ncbi:MAG: hypothetical protein ACFWTZ_04045 [Burkholderia sp.]|jgi:dipeptidase
MDTQRFAFPAAAGPSEDACSTIVVGRKASSTGRILIGHSEDNGGLIFNPQHYVPPARHREGEKIRYEPGTAEIPLPRETLGFYWSQTLSPAGESFGDCFVNDAGVVIVSNACVGIYDAGQSVTEGGIGYGLRRSMAERAHSAREAVNIAAELLSRYGYISEGRTYTVADPEEAWQIAVLQGRGWAARRVGEREVIYLPNCFMMQRLKPDGETTLVSPGLYERLRKAGHFLASDDGSFDFRTAVQSSARRTDARNSIRNCLAWKRLAGIRVEDPDEAPYCAVPERTVSPEDVRDALRLHEGDFGQAEAGWLHYSGYGVCRPTTHESMVLELRRPAFLISGARTYSRPCETPYVPFFPLAGPAAALEEKSGSAALAAQFAGNPEDFDWREARGSAPFVKAANAADFLRGESYERLAAAVRSLEEGWKGEREALAEKFAASPKAEALPALHAFNEEKLAQAQAAVGRLFPELMPCRFEILAERIDPESDEPFEAALYEAPGVNLEALRLAHTRIGAGREAVGNLETLEGHSAPALRMEIRTIGGRRAAVFAFSQKAAAAGLLKGSCRDLWLYTDENGRRITACAAVLVGRKA